MKPKDRWKFAGRLAGTGEYMFYRLSEVPGFGTAVMTTAFVPIADFWSGRPLRVLQQTPRRTVVAA